MRLSGISSGALQVPQGPTRSPSTDGPFHDVDLGGPPRARASNSASAAVRTALQSFMATAGDAFSSLKGNLATAKNKVFDLAGKAAHGFKAAFDNAAQRVSSGLSAAASALSKLATRADVPNAPAPPPDYTTLHSEHYDAVLPLANATTDSSLGTFMRNDNESARGPKITGGDYFKSGVDRIVAQVKDMPPIALSERAARRDGSSTFATMAADRRSDDAIARSGFSTVETILENIIGKPGDDASIKEAVGRMPKALKDQFNIAFSAISASHAPAHLKPDMELNVVRNAFLRNTNAMLSQTKLGPREAQGDTNSREVARALMTLLNGKDLTQGYSPSVASVSAGRGQAWGDTVAKVVAFIKAEADPRVIQAAANGAIARSEFSAMAETAEDLQAMS